MATATVTEIVTKTINATASASSALRAAPQGGILEGGNPSKYDPKNPIILFIIQAAIILIFCRILHFPLSRLRQPRVIAEVIVGILLGPSVMGRIPGFNNAIFPTASMPALTLAANLGLVLFLFLVGLEVDLRYLASNWKIALSVGAAGMALPFGLGCAIAYGLYHQFRDEAGIKPISLGVYMLFIGVAMAITAFPVLCRILTELKLLGTPVGVVVLSAGVGNDVVGWILLALCVALVNSGAGVTALYILLVAVGYALLLVFAIRPGFMWILRRTGSLHNGPTQSVVALTILMVLTSAFFTGIIGIHPIFGAFMIGLICPHEGGFAIKLTEKIEDLVSVLFLPLYFALSGLSTNLGLLNNGITWAYVVGVTAIAFFAKITGGFLASWLNGLVIRESLTIGVLMSCKGLIELIVLNIGLQAKILSQRTFTVFVVMALVTTFATTPLTTLLYPKWYQDKLELWKKGKIDWDGNVILADDTSSDRARESGELARFTAARKVMVYLRLDGLPTLTRLLSLLSGPAPALKSDSRKHPKDLAQKQATPQESHISLRQISRPLQVHALRLAELTERESSVMRVSDSDEYATRDPVIKALRMVGPTSDIRISGDVAVVPERSFAGTLLSKATETASDLLLIPWSETGSMSEHRSFQVSEELLLNRSFISLVHDVFEEAKDVGIGVFVDYTCLHEALFQIGQDDHITRTLSRTATGLSLVDAPRQQLEHQARVRESERNGYHFLVPFQGTEDDCFAIRLALQFSLNDNITATIINLTGSATSQAQSQHSKENAAFFLSSTQSNLNSSQASRIVFEDSAHTVHKALDNNFLDLERSYTEKDMPRLVVLAGRSGVQDESAPLSFRNAPSGLPSLLQTLGPMVQDVFDQSNRTTSLLVVQAKRETERAGSLKRRVSDRSQHGR